MASRISADDYQFCNLDPLDISSFQLYSKCALSRSRVWRTNMGDRSYWVLDDFDSHWIGVSHGLTDSLDDMTCGSSTDATSFT